MSPWIFIGFFGQGLFFMRFLVQWIASEKVKKSVVPDMFWYFSIGGALVLLVYSIHRQDPVFITGQAMGLIIYFRNIYFIHFHPKKVAKQAQANTPED
ncbi:MAG: lipid-A-disaccharide synthase N-terminal domain-containing protein [Alphaproteobacteria bacterium]|nr:lipid-A-disaccharide synthase N-terminal domain-containing protein [Alphaproteobacteria bacterium]